MKNRKKTGKVSERKMGKVSVIFSMVILLGLLAGCGSAGKEENTSAAEIIHTNTTDEKSSEWEPVDEQAPAGEIPAYHLSAKKFGSEEILAEKNVHTAVIEAGETETGVTIHRVNAEYDSGEIVLG